MRSRALDGRAFRRAAGPAPVPSSPALIEVLDDLSGSMAGGNDATGLRHEALLIAFEHLARSRSGGRAPGWTAQLRSFDQSSPLDFERTSLDRRSVGLLEPRLLAAPLGGSSCLGPSLTAAQAQPWAGPRALVVLSDFELFDDDVPGVLSRLDAFPATAVLALVFSAPVPAGLATSRVQARAIAPDSDPPEAVAHAIVEVAQLLAGAAQPAGAGPTPI